MENAEEESHYHLSREALFQGLSDEERAKAETLERWEKIGYYGAALPLMVGAVAVGAWVAVGVGGVLLAGYALGALGGAPTDSAVGQSTFVRVRGFYQHPLTRAACVREGLKVGLLRESVLRYAGKALLILGTMLVAFAGVAVMAALPEKTRKAVLARVSAWAAKQRPAAEGSPEIDVGADPVVPPAEAKPALARADGASAAPDNERHFRRTVPEAPTRNRSGARPRFPACRL
jgi:hypothetical protein